MPVACRRLQHHPNHQTGHAWRAELAHLVQLLCGQPPRIRLPLVAVLVVLGVKGQQENLQGSRATRQGKPGGQVFGMAQCGGAERDAQRHNQLPFDAIQATHGSWLPLLITALYQHIP